MAPQAKGLWWCKWHACVRLPERPPARCDAGRPTLRHSSNICLARCLLECWKAASGALLYSHPAFFISNSVTATRTAVKRRVIATRTSFAWACHSRTSTHCLLNRVSTNHDNVLCSEAKSESGALPVGLLAPCNWYCSSQASIVKEYH